MRFNLNPSILALVPESILGRVQNGVDTEFSRAVDNGEMEEQSKWRGKVKAASSDKPATIKVGRTLRSKWTLNHNAPGLLVLLSIHLTNIDAECGPMGIGSLPDFAVAWFAKLEREAAAEAAKKAAEAPSVPA